MDRQRKYTYPVLALVKVSFVQNQGEFLTLKPEIGVEIYLFWF